MVSLLDGILVIAFGTHAITSVRGLVSLLALLSAAVVYVMMGFTPNIPKRVFLPVTLFAPVAMLVTIPCYIYFYGRTSWIDLLGSVGQLVLAVSVIFWLRGRIQFKWPLVPDEILGRARFSWRNLAVFLGLTFVVLPTVVGLYLAVCLMAVVNHTTNGFLALRPGGLTVEARKYVRPDGKTVLLVPMVHIGDPDFYWKVSQSFPTNSIILMEGVTDETHLLTNQINYARVAKSLKLSEQQEVFRPTRGHMVRADVDISEFTPATIGLLNVAMLVHSLGLTPDTIKKTLEFSAPPHVERQLIDDLIGKRNQRVLEELRLRLNETDDIVVPWGAAHIPGIAREIQKSGFQLKETQKYQVIRFGGHPGTNAPTVLTEDKAVEPK